MMIRVLGACLILVGCSCFGFMLTKCARSKISLLQNFASAMEYMQCELQYQLLPLPDLCFKTANIANGQVSKIFSLLGSELESQIAPNVSYCISAILRNFDIPREVKVLFEKLGDRLGSFDLDGQLRLLETLQKEATGKLKAYQEGYDARHRCYKTIALCAGAAIVILLI